MILQADSASVRDDVCPTSVTRQAGGCGGFILGYVSSYTYVYVCKHAFRCVYHADFACKACEFELQPGGIEPPRGVLSTPPGPKPGAFASFATAAVSGDRRRLVEAW